MSLSLSALRRCFEGAVPAVIGTCDSDGLPNVAYLSQVHYVDDQHLALSFQFFNTTRRNILANPLATILVADPLTAETYNLHLQYLHTISEGPLFESMKARLAGIASHSGMSDVFRLKGSDIYRLRRIEAIQWGMPAPALPPTPGLLPVLRRSIRRLADCEDLEALLSASLACLAEEFHMHHAMLLMLDAEQNKLYTVASCGYPFSGVGSEVALGEGIIGVAAREREPIRIGHCATEYLYSAAVRESYLQRHAGMDIEMSIPLPGLAKSGSQIAVPIAQGDKLIGVLYAESPQEMRFTWDDEDALVSLADYLALAITNLAQTSEVVEDSAAEAEPPHASGKAVEVRFYPADQSVFIDNDYLIKGVAGAIIWKLLRDYVEQGRVEFSNRELRVDPSLRLPDVVNNLEARLILLQRRLAERCTVLGIEKAGRGRFRLQVHCKLRLQAAAETA